MMSTYQSYLYYTRNPAQTQQRTAADPTVKRAQDYYLANIGKITSAKEFVNNYQLFSYAMKAFGLEDMTYAKSFMTKVLTSELSDPKSFANKLSDTRYKAFAEAFNFGASGAVGDEATAQTSTQSSHLIGLYTAASGKVSTTAQREADYMKSALAASTKVDQITANARLFKDLVKAYALNDFTSADTLKQAIESDPNDPSSFVNQSGQQPGLKSLANDLHAAADGTLTSQTSAQASHMAGRYTQAVVNAMPIAFIETAYMTSAIGAVKSVGDLTGSARLLSDVLLAYGLDASTDVGTLTAALESDVSDPKSLVNQAGQTAGLKQLAEDFNFDSKGKIATQRAAMTGASFGAMSTAYAAQAGTSADAKAAAKTETAYVKGVIDGATSIDDVLNDARVVAYIGKAFGIRSLSATTLRSVLTSDTSSLKSAANTLGPNFAKIAAAFEFTTTGTVGREPARAPQSKTSLAATLSGYLEQTIETQAGQDDAGTQLALYFARKAPTLTNAYQILADPALLKFAQTALGLPKAAATTDIDVQAKQISNGIKFTDLSNPKKLNALVSKFAALYDLANASTEADTISTLFGG